MKKEYIVTEVVKKGKVTNLRFITDKVVPNGAIILDSNVEDAYMYTMAKNHEVAV
jgi:hypothetical protein